MLPIRCDSYIYFTHRSSAYCRFAAWCGMFGIVSIRCIPSMFGMLSSPCVKYFLAQYVRRVVDSLRTLVQCDVFNIFPIRCGRLGSKRYVRHVADSLRGAVHSGMSGIWSIRCERDLNHSTFGTLSIRCATI